MDEIITYRNRIRLGGQIINSTIGILDGMRSESKAMAEHPLLEAARGNLEEALAALNGQHEPKPHVKPGSYKAARGVLADHVDTDITNHCPCCENEKPQIDTAGRFICQNCGREIVTHIITARDYALLVDLARFALEESTTDFMLAGFTIDQERSIKQRCRELVDTAKARKGE